MFRIVRALLVAAALLPSCAMANPMFTHDLDFGFATATKFGKDDPIWSAAMNTLFSYDRPGINLQLGGSYDHVSNGSDDEWGFGGDVFWRERVGTFGVSGGYGSVSTGTAMKQLASYGAFGEWYPLNSLTVRGKAGAFDGDLSGWYSGVGVKYYASPYIAFDIGYDYVSSGRIHTIDVGAEYLISRRYPFSVFAGYEHTQGRATGTDALMIKLKYRLGLAGSLVRLDRLGPTEWDGLVPLR